MIGRAGHDLVHDRFCIELMVDAVATIYDEGARALRPPRWPPADARNLSFEGTLHSRRSLAPSREAPSSPDIAFQRMASPSSRTRPAA